MTGIFETNLTFIFLFPLFCSFSCRHLRNNRSAPQNWWYYACALGKKWGWFDKRVLLFAVHTAISKFVFVRMHLSGDRYSHLDNLMNISSRKGWNIAFLPFLGCSHIRGFSTNILRLTLSYCFHPNSFFFPGKQINDPFLQFLSHTWMIAIFPAFPCFDVFPKHRSLLRVFLFLFTTLWIWLFLTIYFELFSSISLKYIPHSLCMTSVFLSSPVILIYLEFKSLHR